MILDNRWQAVHPSKAAIGVPIGSHYHAAEFERTGTMSYAAAQALRWWLHAVAEVDGIGGRIGLETRIVKHKIGYTYSQERLSEHCVIGGADRSSLMPDLGDKADNKDAPKQAAE